MLWFLCNIHSICDNIPYDCNSKYKWKEIYNLLIAHHLKALISQEILLTYICLHKPCPDSGLYLLTPSLPCFMKLHIYLPKSRLEQIKYTRNMSKISDNNFEFFTDFLKYL